MKLTQVQIELALSEVMDPHLQKDLVSLGMIQNIFIEGSRVSFEIQLTTSACPMRQKMKEECIRAIHETISPEVEVEVRFSSIETSMAQKYSYLSKVKHVIAVASGKGGVGKSTVSANLALALSRMGYRVGLFDADMHGPSLPSMFGVKEKEISQMKPDENGKIVPLERYGVKLMSIGFFIENGKAIVWRGPMASNTLKQLVQETNWSELDYLLIDLPPGTSDVHLSVATLFPIKGAVVVTSPQQLSLEDVKRAVSMFRQTDIAIPILGIVENMAYFSPQDQPEKKYYIFGHEGGVKLAEQLGLDLLGQIPLFEPEAGQKSEETSLAKENSPQSELYKELAKKVIAELNICPL